MRALVVYESMFGNTEDVAQAVMKGLLPNVTAELVEVSDAPNPLPDDVDLLVVGGPTHGFGMSRPGTRDTARRQAGDSLVSRGPGIREWLTGLPPVRRDVVSATFDTPIRQAPVVDRIGGPASRPPASATGVPSHHRTHELLRDRDGGTAGRRGAGPGQAVGRDGRDNRHHPHSAGLLTGPGRRDQRPVKAGPVDPARRAIQVFVETGRPSRHQPPAMRTSLTGRRGVAVVGWP